MSLDRDHIKLLAEVFGVESVIEKDNVEPILRELVDKILAHKKDNEELREEANLILQNVQDSLSIGLNDAREILDEASEVERSRGEAGNDGEDGKPGQDGKPGKDGKDAEEVDIEAIIERVLELIPEPKVFELPEDFTIDASQVVNLPENTTIEVDDVKRLIKEGLGGSTARNLYQLFDIALTEVSDDDILQYNGETNTWENVKHNAVTTVTSTAYTASSYEIILVDDDSAGAEVTITLPPAATTTYKKYYIKKLGSTANVVIDGDGTETIDRGLTAVISTQDEALTVITDRSNWFIV